MVGGLPLGRTGAVIARPCSVAAKPAYASVMVGSRRGAKGRSLRRLDAGPRAMYTYTMDRTQIYLSEAEAAALDRQAVRTGRSRSQLIRAAIDQVYLGESSEHAVAVLENTAGTWHNRREDGARYVGRLRRARLSRVYR